MKRALRQLLLSATFAVAAAAIFAAPASAGWQQVLEECVLEAPLTDYTRAELQEAKRHVTGERLAYTECMARINAAMAALGSGGNGGGPGGGGANKSGVDADGDGVVTPEEKRAAKRKKAREAREIASIDSLKPDDAATIGGDDSSGGGNLGLILAIAALALLAVGGGTWYAARRNPAIANALRRVPLLGRRG